jgi:Uri superfamily endonuclease
MSNESRDAMNLNTKEKWHIDYQSDESVAGLLAHMLWVDVGVVVTFDSNNGRISTERV